MARCQRQQENRGFVIYKRHQFKNGVCKACGMKQTNFYPKPKRLR